MSFQIAGKTAGSIMILEAACMSTGLLMSIIYGEDLRPFLYSIGILLLLGLPLYKIGKRSKDKYSVKGGFITVGLTWLVLSAFGALPFLFDGHFGNYINCFFEAVSGFTTTGSTVLSDIEPLSKGILWWRSFTHFIGGMGVLVLVNAILPTAKDKSHHLLKAEIPGPTSDKLVPKLSDTSKILYGMYIALTLIMVLCLLLSGIGLYDALNISVATAGTGGFAVKNLSIAGYYNIAAEYIISIFMLLFSINFALYFLMLTGKVKQALKSEELHFFLGLVFAAILVITIKITNIYGLADAFRYALFTVASVVSTTGFSNIDYNNWPALCEVVIIILMLCGACAGSTGGGVKSARLVILFKTLRQEVAQYIHPRAVNVVRYDGKVLQEKTVNSVLRFFFIYTVIVFSALLLVSLDGFDFRTNFSAVMTCINNVGPGFGAVGPAENFAALSGLSKIVLSFSMLIGRLEIYPIIILFTPSAWRKD